MDECPDQATGSEGGGSTEEYSESTPGNPDLPDDSVSEAAKPDTFWARAGFASFRDYLRDFEEEQARLARQFGEKPYVGPLQVLEGRADEPDLELPSKEVEQVAVPAARQRRTSQVSVKLKPQEHALLCEAAAEYGVAPGTLARMFVVRGAQAIAERRRRSGD